MGRSRKRDAASLPPSLLLFMLLLEPAQLLQIGGGIFSRAAGGFRAGGARPVRGVGAQKAGGRGQSWRLAPSGVAVSSVKAAKACGHGVSVVRGRRGLGSQRSKRNSWLRVEPNTTTTSSINSSSSGGRGRSRSSRVSRAVSTLGQQLRDRSIPLRKKQRPDNHDSAILALPAPLPLVCRPQLLLLGFSVDPGGFSSSFSSFSSSFSSVSSSSARLWEALAMGVRGLLERRTTFFVAGVVLSTFLGRAVTTHRRRQADREREREAKEAEDEASELSALSPARLMHDLSGLEAAAVLKAAVGFDIFTQIQRANTVQKTGSILKRTDGFNPSTGATAARIAQLCSLSVRGSRTLLDSLVALGYLDKATPKSATMTKIVQPIQKASQSVEQAWSSSQHPDDVGNPGSSTNTGISTTSTSRSSTFTDGRSSGSGSSSSSDSSSSDSSSGERDVEGEAAAVVVAAAGAVGAVATAALTPLPRYHLSPSSAAFLSKDSPRYMGNVVDWYTSEEYSSRLLTDLMGAAHTGAALRPITAMAPGIWVKCAQAFGDLVAQTSGPMLAQMALDRTLSTMEGVPKVGAAVLDARASHGQFGISVAKLLDGVSVTAMDNPEVLDVASHNAQSAGLTVLTHPDNNKDEAGGTASAPRGRGKVSTWTGLAGDVTRGKSKEQLKGKGYYDAVLLQDVVHRMGRNDGVATLRRLRSTLNEDGAVYVYERSVADENRCQRGVLLDTTQLVLAKEGGAYSLTEIAAMCKVAGFSGGAVEKVPLPHHGGLVVAYASEQNYRKRRLALAQAAASKRRGGGQEKGQGRREEDIERMAAEERALQLRRRQQAGEDSSSPVGMKDFMSFMEDMVKGLFDWNGGD